MSIAIRSLELSVYIWAFDFKTRKTVTLCYFLLLQKLFSTLMTAKTTRLELSPIQIMAFILMPNIVLKWIVKVLHFFKGWEVFSETGSIHGVRYLSLRNNALQWFGASTFENWKFTVACAGTRWKIGFRLTLMPARTDKISQKKEFAGAYQTGKLHGGNSVRKCVFLQFEF